MNLRISCRFLVFAVLLGCIWRAVGAEPHSAATGFRFRRIYLSDSETRVAQLRLPENGPPIAVDNIPILARKDFGDFLVRYIGREITEASLAQLVGDITIYVHEHGQPLVEVSIPAQNVANGEVRLIVVVGRYDLRRLIVADTEEKAAALQPSPQSGQIVVEDEPALATREFAEAIAAHFGHPITDEMANKLLGEMDAYLKQRGQILAHASIPRQDLSTGQLRLAVAVGRYPLHRIVVADSEADAAAIRVPRTAPAVYAPGQPLFASAEFRRLVQPYLGQPISHDRTDALRGQIADFVRRHDRLVLSVDQPQVDLNAGEMRIAVLIARYGQVQFKGNKWFSNRLLAREIGVHPGQEIRVSELEAAVNRANQSPYRHLEATINALNQPGRAEVGLELEEREVLPLRVSATYDDTGNNLIGNSHYSASVQFGNLWGRDDQFSYQMTTTDSFTRYHVQLATYRAQLPWNDYVNAVFADASYRAAQDPFLFAGKNYVGDLRYVHPIFGDTWSLEFSLGADYKQIDTTSVYGGGFVLANTVNSVAQATAGATYVQHDVRGSWVAALTLNGSPGGINNRNTNARFQGNVAIDPTTGQPVGGPEAEAKYLYGTAVLQRLWFLPADFQLLFRGQAQLASARLLATERMAIGGAATVRGYNERVMSGDHGWDFTIEAHSPAWKFHVPFTPRTFAPWENRLIAFFDDGRVDVRHPRPDDFPVHRLASFGLGLRSNWAANFSLSADYGWQLERTGTGFLAQPNRSRGEIQATLSY